MLRIKTKSTVKLSVLSLCILYIIDKKNLMTELCSCFVMFCYVKEFILNENSKYWNCWLYELTYLMVMAIFLCIEKFLMNIIIFCYVESSGTILHWVLNNSMLIISHMGVEYYYRVSGAVRDR